jgi:hypothetical protein
MLRLRVSVIEITDISMFARRSTFVHMFVIITQIVTIETVFIVKNHLSNRFC